MAKTSQGCRNILGSETIGSRLGGHGFGVAMKVPESI